MVKSFIYLFAFALLIYGCKKDDDQSSPSPVIGNRPEIILFGDDTIQIGLNQTSFPEPGYSASDVEDGDLTASVILDVSSINTSQIGFYSKRYTVKDSDNNQVTKRRIYQVTNSSANNPPLITLLGDNPYQVEMRTLYVEPGYTAMDQEDGDLTSSVQTDLSDIDMSLPGTYDAVYTVYDSDANVDTDTRTISLVATANALSGTYNVVDSCGSGSTLQVYTYGQIVSFQSSTTIRFSKFADYSGNTSITAIIQPGGGIVLPLQSALNIGSLSEDHVFQGTGNVMSNGFFINYSDRNNSAVPVTTAFCRAYFIW